MYFFFKKLQLNGTFQVLICESGDQIGNRKQTKSILPKFWPMRCGNYLHACHVSCVIYIMIAADPFMFLMLCFVGLLSPNVKNLAVGSSFVNILSYLSKILQLNNILLPAA